MDIERLNATAVQELVTRLTLQHAERLDEKSLEMIRQKCDGNPLFVEELTRHYVARSEAGSNDASSNGAVDLVPNVLQGPLMERLDRSGNAKKVAQIASVIDGEFDQVLLAEVLGETGSQVGQSLDELVSASVITQKTYNDRTTYQFRHALLRDAVYGSLLNSFCVRMHQRVAFVLEKNLDVSEVGGPNVIAFHFENAGDVENAFKYWLLAGERSLDSGGTQEAANVLANANRLVPKIEVTDENCAEMARMYKAYGYALNASGGIATGSIAHYRTAERYSTRIDDVDSAFEAMSWQFGLHFNAGELIASEEPARRMKQLGEERSYTLGEVAGCQGLGMSLFMQGRFKDAKLEFERALMVGEGTISGVHCFPSMSLTYLAWAHFFLGEQSDAELRVAEAIESARAESAHAIATALGNCSFVYLCLGQIKTVRSLSDELMAHTERYGEVMFQRRAMVLQRWVDAIETSLTDAVLAARDNIFLLLQSKEEIEMTFYLGVLAELQIKNECYHDAVASLDLAFDLAAKNQENFYIAELYRLKGVLSEQGVGGSEKRDQVHFQSLAYQVAKQQGAKGLLARLDGA